MKFNKRILFTMVLVFVMMANLHSKSKNFVNIEHSVNHKDLEVEMTVVSPDGKYVATTGDYQVKIWDNKGNLLATFLDDKPYINPPNEFKYWELQRRIYDIKFLPDSKTLAVSAFNRRIYYLDLNGKVKKKFIVKKLKGAIMNGTLYKMMFFSDNKRLITFEQPYNEEYVIRDKNLKVIKRINMKEGYPYSHNFDQLTSLPNGKGYITTRNPAIPSKDGWKTSLQLFSKNGKLIRDLENDKPGRIKTPDGKMKREFIKPKKFAISTDSNYVAYLQKKSFRDPWNRKVVDKKYPKRRKKKVEWYGRIRVVNIKNGKRFEFWLNDDQRRIRRISFSKNGKNIIGFAAYNMFHFSKKGTLIKTVPHEKLHKNKNFEVQDIVESPKLNFVTAEYRKNRLWSFYGSDGKMIREVPKRDFTFKSASMSHNGEFLAFEIDRAKSSIVFDTKKNKIFFRKASIWYDNNNREYSLSHDRKSYINTIKFHDSEIKIGQRETKYFYLRPLPNGNYADFTDGFTLFDKEGEAIRRYAKAGIGQDTAVDPNMKYYVEPKTWSKYKTFIVKKLSGKKIKNFYVGAFMGKDIITSVKGEWIIAGHKKTGVVQIWNNRGKLLRRMMNLHSTQITGLAITKNKRFLLSTARDGSSKIIDLKTNNILKITMFKTGDFIVSDNTRFDCTDNVKHLVSISKDGKNLTSKLFNKMKTNKLLYKFLRGK